MVLKFIFILFLKISLSSSTCIDGKNHCTKCNPITKLCIKCDLNIYSPDENGGCKNANKCEIGKNQCDECNENGELCKKCVEGYFTDENGGCSYTNNCEISYKGKCLKCKEDYILIGQEDIYNNNAIKICKSLNFGDLKHCEEINQLTGLCQKCKEGYYLNNGDKKCISTKNCYESVYDVCTKCNNNYYLDKKDNQCKNQAGVFEYCQVSVDGKTCDICDDNYYFDENGKCISINFCKTPINLNNCEKCIDGYFPSEYKSSCVSTENCLYGDKDIGICKTCKDNYYLDYKDGKCKSNQEDNDFKYCTFVYNNKCLKCSFGHELGEDNKCSSTKYCAESNNGICISCTDNYYLGLDFNCFNVEYCIYSNSYICIECKDNYYYDRKEKKCKIGENNFKNCKSGDSSFCESCKDDFYLNKTDNLCYSNKNYGRYYKCSETDINSEECTDCVEGYYLGYEDNKCSLIEGCALSENENKCLKCGQYYCLDSKTGQCKDNDIIEDEDKKYYFRCNKTDEKGTKCEVCSDENLLLDENGLCIDYEHCLEKNEDGTCKKCQDNKEGTYCLNKYFGCVNISYKNNCLECDNLFYFLYCTKCIDGYTLNNGNCLLNNNI